MMQILKTKEIFFKKNPILSGVNNVEQIQDQLDGMLFGGNGEKFTSEKFTREKFTPSDVLDSQKTESQVQNTKVSPITQTVIDGDRGKKTKKIRGENVNNFTSYFFCS